MKPSAKHDKKFEQRDEPAESSLVIRNLYSAGGKTSMRLEPELWDAVDYICRKENIDFDTLVSNAVAGSSKGGRTSAVRVYIIRYLSRVAGI